MELLSKARIKLIHSLQHKKYRLKYDKFIVEGLKITKELLGAQENIVETIYISNPDYQSILQETGKQDHIVLIEPREMKAISQMNTPPGVLAVCHLPAPVTMPENLAGRKVFYLDGVRDPGNMGTILRIADWFGMEYMLLSPDCADIYNPKVIQASMGSFSRVKAITLDPALLTEFDVPILLCDMNGEDIDTMPSPEEGIIVLGNESKGASPEVKKCVTNTISISGKNALGAESLNVASVAGIIGFWLRKI